MKDFIKYFIIGSCISYFIFLTKNDIMIFFAGKPELQILSNSIKNFNVISKNDLAIHYFKFKNIGRGDLIISDVETTCGCTVSEWNDKAIKKNQIDSIKVSYDTSILGDFKKPIIIHSNDKKSSNIRLYIEGNVQPINTPYKKDIVDYIK